jgi:hypothetical protein
MLAERMWRVEEIDAESRFLGFARNDKFVSLEWQVFGSEWQVSAWNDEELRIGSGAGRYGYRY